MQRKNKAFENQQQVNHQSQFVKFNYPDKFGI